MKAVFDTNIVIDALNGVVQADEEYHRYDQVMISRITWMEVLVGVKDDDSQLRDFLEYHFNVVEVDLVIADLAVQLSRTYHMRLPDAIIWATAQSRSAVLVTRNTKDFNPEWENVRLPYQV